MDFGKPAFVLSRHFDGRVYVLGNGSLFGITIIPEQIDRISIMTTPPGGFLTFGMLMALVIFLETKMGQKKKRAIGCEGCPSAANCQSKGACN